MVMNGCVCCVLVLWIVCVNIFLLVLVLLSMRIGSCLFVMCSVSLVCCVMCGLLLCRNGVSVLM